MKVILEFDNDEGCARVAMAAPAMYSALHEIVHKHLHNYFKYTEGSQEAAEKVLEAIKEEAAEALPREVD